MPPVPYPPLRGTFPLEGKAGDTGETCHRKPSDIAPQANPEV